MRTDKELMTSYRDGDDRAFAELFRRYAPVLSRYFERRQRSAADCQDLVQKTFLQLHRARRDWKSGDSLRPWLFTIARNLNIDHSRQLKRRPESPLDVDSHAGASVQADGISVAERARAVFDALARLSDEERGLLDEHWLDGRSFEEIAERDGARSTTLRVRAHRACRKLRSWIDPVHLSFAD